MLASLRTLLLLSVLCAPTSSLCLRFYHTDTNLLCDDHLLPRLRSSDVRPEEEDLPLDVWNSLFGSAETPSSSREKRTSSHPANYRFLSQTKLRGKVLQNSLKGDRRSKFTLSLDVPTNIMNVLFHIAKAKSLRAKAADNARLMAQIGRRK